MYALQTTALLSALFFSVTARAQSLPSSCTDADTTISPEQQDWVNTYFFPHVLGQRAAEHPVRDVRTAYVSSMNAAHALGTQVVVHDCLFGNPDTLAVTEFDESGQARIIWSLAAIRAAKTRYSESDWLDLMLVQQMHEANLVLADHADHDRLWVSTSADLETEAWQQTIEQVILPMRNAGRLKPMPPELIPQLDRYFEQRKRGQPAT